MGKPAQRTDEMRLYRVKGTWREIGAIGAHEPFERGFYGFSADDVRAVFPASVSRIRKDVLIHSVKEA